MKYIGDKEENGVLVDWHAVRRLMESLDIPEGFYRVPWGAIENGNKYIMPLSSRSTGKTTTFLLLGLCLSAWSGWKLQTAYIRPTEGELAQSHAERLVEVINAYREGHYIRKLTNDRYNCLVWHWRQFYLAKRDEEGKVVEKSERPVIQCLSVDRANDYKSSLNMPDVLLILYDEFISPRYRIDEAIHFLDLTKTLIREKLSPIIVMCANTISVTSPYYEELEISREVKRMHAGDRREITTDRGTKIYVELVDLERYRKKDNRRSIVNRLFYGFSNPKLNAIHGEGELFAFDSVPHILHRAEGDRLINGRVYVEFVGELLRLEFRYNDVQGYHIEVHRASRYYDDSTVLSCRVVDDPQYRFGFGGETLEKAINNAIYDRRVYFSSNEVGAIFYDYVDRVEQERRKY